MKISRNIQTIKTQIGNVNRFEKEKGFQIKDDVILGGRETDDNFLVKMNDLASLSSKEEEKVKDLFTGRTFGNFVGRYAAMSGGAGMVIGGLIGLVCSEGVPMAGLALGSFFGAAGVAVGTFAGMMDFHPNTPPMYG